MLIPTQVVHSFRRMPSTHSDANRPAWKGRHCGEPGTPVRRSWRKEGELDDLK